MPTRLTLTSPAWATHGSTRARGQAYDPAGRLLRAAELAAVFDAAGGDDAWHATAAGFNGCFAAVRVDGDEVRAAVDRLRTMPLFFASAGDVAYLGDSADELRREALAGVALDPICVSEFRQTGYVTGAQTLVPGLEQIRAGHGLYRPSGARRAFVQRSYYAFRHQDFLADSDAALIDRLVATHERVFRRLLDDVGDRPVVVPLSGGHDSRLIGVMLRELGCRNVLCYSYGAPGNWEAKISQELAGHLGFRWTMVPYSMSSWRRDAATPEFRRYFRAAGNLTSIPHLQDWPAVRELERRGELSPDAVFVPGHSGDFLAGSHIPSWFPARASITRREILQSIFDAHYALWDWPRGEVEALRVAFARRIDAVAGPVRDSVPEAAADLFECWDWQERQAKFIVNSVRVYEAHGREWRLPLFDAELMDLWSRMPLEARARRRLYFRFADEHVRLPVTPPNTDRSPPAAAAVALIDRLGLKPLAKWVRRAVRRARYRQCYEGSEMAWFALVDPEEFRARFTGREIAHSFFALQYLAALAE